MRPRRRQATAPTSRAEAVDAAGGAGPIDGVAGQSQLRAKLERLCRYVSRPPVATERMALTSSGQVLPAHERGVQTPERAAVLIVQGGGGVERIERGHPVGIEGVADRAAAPLALDGGEGRAMPVSEQGEGEGIFAGL
jgi:hypothetical protein